ncbi:MAG: OPT family oligopeptide transporter, partial [Gemmatimonadota bacterium]
LENNIVQTAASAGESLAAGIIFTVPALVLIGTWAGFHYWETTMIAAFGGLLGVLFTIPLRRALIVEEPLRFPEGVATAEVLKVGDRGGSEVRFLAWAAVIGALFKFGNTGLRLWAEAVEKARYIGGSIGYVGTNVSPALVGVGYIVGLHIAILIFLGGAINWYVAIPIVAWLQGVPPDAADAVTAANRIWSAQTRFLGVGAMVVGGLWALIRMRGSLFTGIRSGMDAYRRMRRGEVLTLDRTERDTPMQWVALAVVLSVIPLFFIFEYFTHDVGVSALMAVLMLVAAFLFSAVSSYMAGLVGSSNNPISGMTIATILTASLLLLALLGSGSAIGPASAIFIGAVVASAAAIGGDNMQDLKAGRIVGATPYKQQIMQGVGVIAAAFVLAPVLTLILKAYGIGVPTAEHPQPLTAPQATLMASVAEGVFGGHLPWTMVILGMLVAVAIIAFDVYQERRGAEFRTPVLAVAVGIYLPLELSVAIFIGGLIAWAASRFRARVAARAPREVVPRLQEAGSAGERHGLLFAAGLITGEALVGIAMAIPIVWAKDRDVAAFWGVHEAEIPGLALLALVIFFLYRVTTAETRKLQAGGGSAR